MDPLRRDAATFAYNKGARMNTSPLASTEQLLDKMDEPFLYDGGEISYEFRKGITCVRIGPQVTTIASGAFARCHCLTDVQFNERLQVVEDYAFEYCTELRSVTIPSTVTELGKRAFMGCRNLTEVRFSEGLRVIGDYAFASCTALRSVFLPRTATHLGRWAFHCCTNLAEVRLNEGLQAIEERSFASCGALRSLAIPSTVTRLGQHAFAVCSSLTEVFFLGSERLLNQEFLDHGHFGGERELLNHAALEEIIRPRENLAFLRCPFVMVKVPVSRALSERIQRLAHECKLSVEERIRGLPRLELMQDGNVVACFPVVRSASEAHFPFGGTSNGFDVQDTNLETSRSMYQVLQWVAFHELKESSTLIELALWKSRIDGARNVSRDDCRVPIPDPVKHLVMEYCGFAEFLRPTMDDT
mmetsp:Transcript_2907/g.6490  ORF Transcript_2907/g.6490 Transcript_2907/m.6490 type:complete len:415 (+) Transcript_2907:141-1385(+)